MRVREYKKYVTITDPKRLKRSELLFPSGQRVEMAVISADLGRKNQVQELRALLKKTLALLAVKAINKNMIAKEITQSRA